MESALTRGRYFGNRERGLISCRQEAYEGRFMTLGIVRLGAVTKRTLDYSGTNWWDSITFSMRKLLILW